MGFSLFLLFLFVFSLIFSVSLPLSFFPLHSFFLFFFYFFHTHSFSFNSSFLAEIEKCIEEPERLGILFKRYERRLGMYIIYCQNKPKSEFIVSEHDAYFEVRIFSIPLFICNIFLYLSLIFSHFSNFPYFTIFLYHFSNFF